MAQFIKNGILNMQQFKLSSFMVMLVILIVIAGYSSGFAAPPRPEAPPVQADYVFGKVTINGVYVPEGTSVSAWCTGVMVAETTTIIEIVGDEHQAWYSLDIPADDPDTMEKDGCVVGDWVNFKIISFDAEQTKEWISGGVPPYILDLSVNNLQQIFLPLTLK